MSSPVLSNQTSSRSDMKSPPHTTRPGSNTSTISAKPAGGPAAQEEEEIDIDLEDPEVQAAANMIQAKFKGKFKGKFGMKKPAAKTVSKPEVVKTPTPPPSVPSEPVSRVTSAKSDTRSSSTVTSPTNHQVEIAAMSQLIHVQDVGDSAVMADMILDDHQVATLDNLSHLPGVGEGFGLGVPTIGLIPSTPRPESPASSTMSTITIPASVSGNTPTASDSSSPDATSGATANGSILTNPAVLHAQEDAVVCDQ